MLDSLLYEPKRRRIAMVTLFVLLVLAVGFVAVGAWVESAAVLQIFGVAFLALAVGFVGKLLVVSHVHIRGAAGRLEALNDRYDDTSRWLERFDADTRESFLAAKRRFGKVDAARSELEGKLDELAKDTPRLAAIKELGERLDAKVAELAKQSEAVSEALDTFKTEQGAAGEKAEQRASKIETALTGKITELREELAGVATLADRIELLETEVERFDALEKEVERVESQSSEQASKLIADGTAATRKAAADDLEAAKAELTEQLKQLSGRVNKINDEHDRKRKSAVHAAREELGATVTGLSKRVDNTAQLAGRQRGDGYVQFPRVLSEEAMAAASSFNAKVTPKHLKYLERKLQVIEGLCEGRLAGSVDDAVARALSAHMVKGKELRILEIGVLFGVGAAFLHHVLAPRHERVKLALLDPFQGYYGSDHLDPLTGLPVTRGAVERNMARCGIPADDVEILEGFSHEEAIQAAAEEAGPYHVIVIDGDHTMQGVRTDYEGYADMLRSGGLLVIDDYGSEDWPDVTAFVDETVRSDPRFKQVAIMGKTAVFKRGRTPGGKKAASRTSSRKAAPAAELKSEADTSSQPEPKAETKPTPKADTSKPQAKAESKAGTRVEPKKAGSTKVSPAKEPAETEPPAPVVETPKRPKKATKKASKKKAQSRSGRAAKKSEPAAAEPAEVSAVAGGAGDAKS